MTNQLRKVFLGLGIIGLVLAGTPAPAEAQFRIIPACRATPETKNECSLFCSSDCRNVPSGQHTQCITQCEARHKCHLDSCDVFTVIALIVNIYNYLLWLAAFIALLLIIFGGVRMFLIGFSETPEEDLMAAKNTVRRAIAGLVIILTAFLIVNTLLYFLGFQFSDDPPFATVPWFLKWFGITG